MWQERENHGSLPTAGVHSDENEAWDYSAQMHGKSVTNSTVVGSMKLEGKSWNVRTVHFFSV